MSIILLKLFLKKIHIDITEENQFFREFKIPLTQPATYYYHKYLRRKAIKHSFWLKIDEAKYQY